MADVAECIDKLVAAKTISRKVADVNSPVRPEYPQTRVATPCSVFFLNRRRKQPSISCTIVDPFSWLRLMH
jgi:hypothetical protein